MDKMLVFWGILVVVFGIMEGATVQLVSIWFVLGSLAALIASCVDAPVYLQFVIFTVTSVISLIFTRPLVKKHLLIKTEATNTDKCIGQEGIVIENIDNINNQGQVKVNGQIWSAKSKNDEDIILKDTYVKVEKIEGVKVVVSLMNKNN